MRGKCPGCGVSRIQSRMVLDGIYRCDNCYTIFEESESMTNADKEGG